MKLKFYCLSNFSFSLLIYSFCYYLTLFLCFKNSPYISTLNVFLNKFGLFELLAPIGECLIYYFYTHGSILLIKVRSCTFYKLYVNGSSYIFIYLSLDNFLRRPSSRVSSYTILWPKADAPYNASYLIFD